MAFLIQLLANYAGLIYIGCAIGVAFSVRDILAARAEIQVTRYSLEREAASSRIVRGSIMVVLFIGVAIGLVGSLALSLAVLLSPPPLTAA